MRYTVLSKSAALYLKCVHYRLNWAEKGVVLSNFFSILSTPFRHFPFLLSLSSLPFLPVPSLSSLPVPSRSRTSGSDGYEAQPGQVECVFCRRWRRRHDHLWPMVTSIRINISSQLHWAAWSVAAYEKYTIHNHFILCI